MTDFTIRTTDQMRTETIMYGRLKEAARDSYRTWSRRLCAAWLGLIAVGVVVEIVMLNWRAAHGVFHG